MFYLFGENDEPKWYTGPKLCNTHGSHTHVYNIYTYAITLYYKTQTKDEIDFKYIQQHWKKWFGPLLNITWFIQGYFTDLNVLLNPTYLF